MLDFFYRHLYEYGTLLRWGAFVVLCSLMVYAFMRMANGYVREGVSMLLVCAGLMYAAAPTRYPFYLTLAAVLLVGACVGALAMLAMSRIGR